MFLGRRATKRWHRPATIALWVLVVYLLLLWAAIRWGHASPDRFPGSD